MTKKIFLDEAHYLSEATNQSLIEEVRGLPGIPDVNYRVEGEYVFVFDKLISLLKNQSFPSEQNARHQALLTAATSALTHALATPLDAVQQWNVLPEGFVINIDGDTGRVIVAQKTLHSVIPVDLQNGNQAQELLAELLMGRTVPTPYDAMVEVSGLYTEKAFVGECEVTVMYYRFFGQTYKHVTNGENTFDFPLTPISDFFPSSGPVHLPAEKVETWQSGFPLLSREHYCKLVHYACSWMKDSNYAKELSVKAFCGENGKGFSELLHSLDMTTPFMPHSWFLSEDEIPLLDALRRIYPEADHVPDVELVSAYSSWHTRHGYISADETDSIARDDQFLFHLVGEYIVFPLRINNVEYSSQDIGKVTGYFVLNGLRGEALVEKVRHYAKHNLLVLSAMWNCKWIFYYIRKINEAGGAITSGKPVTTFADLFRKSRSYSPKLVEATQNLSDLIGNEGVIQRTLH